MKRCWLAWLAGLLPVALGLPLACAAGEGASHAQRFRYDAETSFAILALPGVPTDLQLAADERVTGFALGDTIQWLIEELPGHVFVKPLKAELFTAGTLVTDRRTYQLTLRSGHPRDDWMQRVSWSYPDLVVLRAPSAPLPHAAERIAAAPADPAGPPGAALPGAGPPASATGAGGRFGDGLDPARLDFDYQVSGDAPFRPLAVFDDGLSTWLRMPPRQALPAVFLLADGETQLLHYAVRGDWLVVPRLVPQLVLKLGRSEVQVQRHATGADPGMAAQHEPFRR